MSKSQGITSSRWSLAILLAIQGCLMSGCDPEVDEVVQDGESEEYIDNPGVIKTDILQLGNKWRLSAIGDAHGNDDWLRLFDIGNNGYYGGLAAGRLWSISGTLSGSDIRLKTDVAPFSPPLDQLMSLQAVEFRWKHDPADHEIGLIAQEVESVFPELVEVGPDGFKGIEYDGLTALMLEGMKQQQAQIASLQDEVQSLRVELREATR
jgi:hypothetical protein